MNVKLIVLLSSSGSKAYAIYNVRIMKPLQTSNQKMQV